MVIEWKTGQRIPVNTLSRDTSLIVHDNGLLVSEMVRLLKAFNVETEPCSDVKAAIDEGRPSIALIRYGYISERLNQRFSGLHFVVAYSYDDTHVIVADPDWYGVRRNEGARFAIPNAEWDKAFETAVAIL
jgi:hypothetical protein